MLMEKEPKPLPTPLAFLRAVYSNESLPLSARLKAAIEAAQYVHPKLAVTATINSGDFAIQLDNAIREVGRSKPNQSPTSQPVLAPVTLQGL